MTLKLAENYDLDLYWRSSKQSQLIDCSCHSVWENDNNSVFLEFHRPQWPWIKVMTILSEGHQNRHRWYTASVIVSEKMTVIMFSRISTSPSELDLEWRSPLLVVLWRSCLLIPSRQLSLLQSQTCLKKCQCCIIFQVSYQLLWPWVKVTEACMHWSFCQRLPLWQLSWL